MLKKTAEITTTYQIIEEQWHAKRCGLLQGVEKKTNDTCFHTHTLSDST
jgi:hypothetical protein